MPKRHPDDIPPVLLRSAIALVVSAVVLTGLATNTGIGVQKSKNPGLDLEKSLVFSDGADGAIDVYDPVTGERVHSFPSDGFGFVRTALRALAFERKTNNLTGELPVRLLRTTSGQVILEDPATGARITLDAFGGDNARTFDVLLAEQSS